MSKSNLKSILIILVILGLGGIFIYLLPDTKPPIYPVLAEGVIEKIEINPSTYFKPTSYIITVKTTQGIAKYEVHYRMCDRCITGNLVKVLRNDNGYFFVR